MAYAPRFTITPGLLARIEEIAALRARIQAASVEVPWIPMLQKDARIRNAHASTAIEGNPLTLEQVRALDEGRPVAAITPRSKKEVLNYFDGLKFVEKHATKKTITHEDVYRLHGILAEGVMDQGEPGVYRTIRVRVGRHIPPPPEEVRGLMDGLIGWWNDEAGRWSPVVSSAVVHYRFEDIHPFADGNGRVGRMLALWELFRRGFDTNHIFAVDEYYWDDRSRYCAALDEVRQSDEDLTRWIEYCAEGIHRTLEAVQARLERISVETGAAKITLRPRQEKLLGLLHDKGGMVPREIWKALGVSKQGAMDLLKPLIEAGLVKRVGTKKSGKYVLA
jgi:Fic family protein